MVQKNKLFSICRRITVACLVAIMVFSDFGSVISSAEEEIPASVEPNTIVETEEGLTDIVLKGTSRSGKSADMPVYCIKKGTAPGKHAAIFFAGDGYTIDQQDSFIADVKDKTDYFFGISPMNYFEDWFDVYAVQVPSEGSGKYSNDNDTFFQISSAAIGSGTKQHLFDNIRNNLAAALGIDKDNDVYTTVLISNASYGQGMSDNFYSVIGKGSPEVFVHETGHAANDLTDEYWASEMLNGGTVKKANRIYITDIAKDGLDASELANLTMYDYDKLDVNKVRWKSYLGFRGTYIDGFDHTSNNFTDASIKELRPNHKATMMGAAGKPFCPVCEAEIFKQLNNRFGKPYDILIPKPEFSYALTENPLYFCNQQNNVGYKKPDKTYLPSNEKLGGPEAEFKTFDTLSKTDASGNNTDFADASAHTLTFRTVVLPFNKAANLMLRIAFLDKDNRLLCEFERDFEVSTLCGSDFASAYGTSLEFTIKPEDVITAIGSLPPAKCKLVGEVIDINSGKILSSTAPLTTSAYYGNSEEKTTTLVESYGTLTTPVSMQDIHNVTPPDIEGYTLTAPADNAVTYDSSTGTFHAAYYYTKDLGTVTQILLDENGKEVNRKTSSVARDTSFVPSESDFSVPSGYTLTLPDSFFYNGLSAGCTLTYQYHKTPEPEKPVVPDKPVVPNPPVVPDKPVVPNPPVKPPVPVTLSLSKKKLSFDTIGSSKTITAKVTPSGTPVTWRTSNKKVAVVSRGKIKAVGNGKAVITAAAGKKSVSCTVSVSQKSKKVRITYANTTISGKTLKITKGKSYQLKATVTPKNTASANKKIKWSTSNKKIATVSKSGKVKALKPGTVTIKAQTADGRKTTVKFKVVKKKVKVTSLKLSASTKKLQKGKKVTVKASFSPVTAYNKSPG